MTPRTDLLLLSIRAEHAHRIFSGSKIYELRKVLPKAAFHRVYLVETGGRGLIGTFDVADLVRLPIGQLWERVSYQATSSERFFRYFAGCADGYAIEIKSPIRFADPVPISDLKKKDPSFRVPMSFVTIPADSALASFLDARRNDAIKELPARVSLVPIHTSERDQYRRLVRRHVGSKYDGIDNTFAQHALDTHDLRHDPSGFFTVSKEVLSIRWKDRHIGFTTLTWKKSGCVKSGPTILKSKFRRRGLGLSTRLAIEEWARTKFARKIYCTCADNDKPTISYLLGSGLMIEAHLDRQYSTTHGELVMGKFLAADEAVFTEPSPRNARVAVLRNVREFDRSALIRDFRALFVERWGQADEDFIARIVRDSLRKGMPHPETKDRRLLCLSSSGKLCAVLILFPKRGGSIKALLLTKTSHQESLANLVSESIRRSTEMNGRKLFVIHELWDRLVTDVLRKTGFSIEGILRSPFKRGEDAAVFSRFL